MTGAIDAFYVEVEKVDLLRTKEQELPAEFNPYLSAK